MMVICSLLLLIVTAILLELPVLPGRSSRHGPNGAMNVLRWVHPSRKLAVGFGSALRIAR
jgi:hypothetical protein